MRPGELPGNEVRSVRSGPLAECRGILPRSGIPLWTMSTRIYVAPLAHVTRGRRLDRLRRAGGNPPRGKENGFRIAPTYSWTRMGDG